jgi:hypothetical protein
MWDVSSQSIYMQTVAKGVLVESRGKKATFCITPEPGWRVSDIEAGDEVYLAES